MIYAWHFEHFFDITFHQKSLKNQSYFHIPHVVFFLWLDMETHLATMSAILAADYTCKILKFLPILIVFATDLAAENIIKILKILNAILAADFEV